MPFFPVRCPPVRERTSVNDAWDDVVIALSMAVAKGIETSASELRHMSGVPMFRTLRAIERIDAQVGVVH